MTRAYGGQSLWRDEAWWFEFPSGVTLKWNDGVDKDFGGRLAEPDLQDMFLVPYPSGPVVPVVDANHDPGRVRLTALFDEIYGGSQADVQSQLIVTPFVGSRIRIHRKVRGPFEAVQRRLRELLERDGSLGAYLSPLGGSFAFRDIAGTTRRSAHSWGIAVDLNPSRSDYWRNGRAGQPWRNRVPQSIVRAFEAEGFVWGGRWRHFDTMHFEYRPELLDPLCRGN